MNDSTRKRIQEQNRQREYNRRKGAVEMLVKQHRGYVDAAIEFYKTELCKKMAVIPQPILDDLQQIGRELKFSGKKSAVAHVN